MNLNHIRSLNPLSLFKGRNTASKSQLENTGDDRVRGVSVLHDAWGFMAHPYAFPHPSMRLPIELGAMWAQDLGPSNRTASILDFKVSFE